MEKRLMSISPCSIKGKYNEIDFNSYPMIVLKNELKKRNIDIFNFNPKIKDPDAIIFFDYFKWAYKRIEDIPFKYKVLYLSESTAVNSEQYESKISSQFDLVFTWNDSIVVNNKIVKFNIPVVGNMIGSTNDFSARKKYIVMNANKYSFYDTERYSYRRECIDFLDSNNLELDLYGPYWQKNYYFRPKKLIGFFRKGFLDAIGKKQPHKILNLISHFKSLNLERKCYKGVAKDKYETLSKYKYCICFENDITPGDISEKIFDCFFCGTIPIYLGASNIEAYIPKETFIDMRQFCDFNQLVEYIDTLSECDERVILEAGKNYVQSAEFHNIWRPEKVYERIAEELAANL